MKSRVSLTIVVLLLLAPVVSAQGRQAPWWSATIREAAGRYAVNPNLLWTICYLESRFQLRVVSPKGARGPFQFMPQTASRYSLRNPYDFRESAFAAAHYIRDLSERYQGRVHLILAAYNAGEGAVERWGGRVPPYRETRDYAGRGVAIFNRLVRQGMFPAGVAEQVTKKNSFRTMRSRAPLTIIFDDSLELEMMPDGEAEIENTEATR